MLTHTAIDVDAEHLHVCAAVGLATAASDAIATIQVGDDAASISDGIIRFLVGRADLEDFDSQLMAHDARIAEEILIAAKRMQVRAADADAPDLHQNLIPSHACWRGDILQAELARLL